MTTMRSFIAAVLLTIFCVAPQSVFARDAARDLRRMVGYTIVDATTVEKVVDRGLGGKMLVLANGMVFKVDMLLLDPLPLTDVIVFAKKVGKPDAILLKLLIDNEAHDAKQLK
jgi:hypothetical protein